MSRLEIAKIVGKQLRADGFHLDYRPEHKVGPRRDRDVNHRGVAVKQYQGNRDVAYVDRWGLNADPTEIRNWAILQELEVDTDPSGKLLISR